MNYVLVKCYTQVHLLTASIVQPVLSKHPMTNVLASDRCSLNTGEFSMHLPFSGNGIHACLIQVACLIEVATKIGFTVRPC